MDTVQAAQPFIQTRGTVGTVCDGISGLTQRLGERGGDAEVIFDEQQAHRSSLPELSGASLIWAWLMRAG